MAENKAKTMASEELIKALNKEYSYEPDTGLIFSKKSNKYVGFKNNNYIRVYVSEKIQMYAHQIAFAIMLKHIPEEIDHIDRNRSNNKWNNLRSADRFINNKNVSKNINNKSGLKGVSWAKGNNCWRMDIASNKKKYYSYHATKEEAYEAYCKLSESLHKEFGCIE